MDDPGNASLRGEIVALLAAHKDMHAPQYELQLMADHFAFELKVRMMRFGACACIGCIIGCVG